MIPVKQTKDNCMAACWASILEVPLEVVPDYQAIRRSGGLWLNAVNVWLSKHHRVIYHEPERWLTTHVVPEGWHLINLGVPTGDRIDGGHAIVGYFGHPVWDPHGHRPRRGVPVDTWGILPELTEDMEAMWRAQWGTCLCGACIRGESYPSRPVSLNPEVAYAEPVSPAWARGSEIAGPAPVAAGDRGRS